jgi:multidrug resistance efflux pump
MLLTTVLAAAASIVLKTVDVPIENADITPANPGIVPLIATTNGAIRRIHVRQGGLVSQGDTILQLESRDLVLKRRSLESKIHQRETSGGGRKELSDLYRQLETCQLELNSRTLVSPVDGQMIWLGSFQPGDTLRRGTAVATIASRDELEVIGTLSPIVTSRKEPLLWLLLRRLQDFRQIE